MFLWVATAHTQLPFAYETAIRVIIWNARRLANWGCMIRKFHNILRFACTVLFILILFQQNFSMSLHCAAHTAEVATHFHSRQCCLSSIRAQYGRLLNLIVLILIIYNTRQLGRQLRLPFSGCFASFICFDDAKPFMSISWFRIAAFSTLNSFTVIFFTVESMKFAWIMGLFVVNRSGCKHFGF